MPTDSKSSFLSTVKRTRLSDINGRKVAEYEIACQLRMASEKVQKEVVFQWSVWKRFSAFERLHRDLKRTLGWRLVNPRMQAGFGIDSMARTAENLASEHGIARADQDAYA
ncbi:hypothetical protein EON64_00540, partial [archaeon]